MDINGLVSSTLGGSKVSPGTPTTPGNNLGAFHVPVITPQDTPQGDLPPKLEEHPLPAV